MCFGNQVESTKNQSTPDWLQGAALQNVTAAQGLQNQGFTPYGGQQVAPFSGQQQQSFGMGNQIAGATGSNINPGAGALSTALNASTVSPTVNASPISAGMSPYMNQYVNLALAPQLQAAANAYMLQNQGMQGQATSAGAFGDPRAGILQGNLGLNYALENQGLVGNAYNAAFNTAIGASAQDVANSLQAQQATGSFYNQGIQNLLAGSGQAYGQATGGANLQNTFGAQQTALSQAQLNAPYNQWLMSLQYPFQTNQNLGQAIGASLPTNVTTTTSQPDNSGYAILGGILGAGLGGYAKSDVRVKDNIEKIGKLNDGLNVYSYRYKWDDPVVRRVGLMAQEVEKKYPSAVAEIDGVKAVNYLEATKQAANSNQSMSFGIAA